MYTYTHLFLFDKLNTMVDDTENKRPDGYMFQLEERIIKFSTGFIEVKPAKSRTSTQKTHEGTIRLDSIGNESSFSVS